jgi:hypothetical protein
MIVVRYLSASRRIERWYGNQISAAAGQVGPHRLLTFLDPLLRRPLLFVEPHYRPAWCLQVGHDEPYPRKQLPAWNNTWQIRGLNLMTHPRAAEVDLEQSGPSRRGCRCCSARMSRFFPADRRPPKGKIELLPNEAYTYFAPAWYTET